MRRSLSQSDRGSSSTGSSRSSTGSSSKIVGGGGRVRRRPFSSSSYFTSQSFSSSSLSPGHLSPPLPPSPSRGNLGNNVLVLGLDVITLRTVLCHWVPHYSSHNAELVTMLEGLFAELDGADDLHQLVGTVRIGAGSSNNNHHHHSSRSSRRAEQLLGNVVTVLACFLDHCTDAVPTLVIFHAHSLVGQIRDLVLHQNDGALGSYLRALWLASWGGDAAVPPPCAARTLHRIGTVYGLRQGRCHEGRHALRQALAAYAQAGVPVDHPAVVDCQNAYRTVDAAYWATVGANEDSWSSLAGLSDRRGPLPRIREEPDPIEPPRSAGGLHLHHPHDAPA